MPSLRPVALTVLLLVPALVVAGADGSDTADGGASPETPPGGTSMVQTIQGQDGIAVQTMCTNCNNADLSIGSFSNEFIRMECDGLPVPTGLAQIYLLSVVPSTVIDRVSVEKGAGRAELDAGTIGGEIEIRRRRVLPGFQANATIDSGEEGWRSGRADLAGGHGWFTGSLITSVAESDAIDADGDGTPDMAQFDRATIEGRFEAKLANGHRLRVGASTYDESQSDGRGLYDAAETGWRPESVELRRNQYDLTYEGRFGLSGVLELGLLSADRDQEISEEIFGLPTETYDIDERHEHVQLSWSQGMSSRGQLRGGLSWTQRTFGIIDFQFNTSRPFLGPDHRQRERPTETGIWAETELALGGRVTLFSGVRFADFEYTDNRSDPNWVDVPLPEGDAWLPRVALAWKPVDQLRLRVSAGEGYRQPPPSYEEVCCGRRYRGNRGIRMESSKLAGLELTWEPTTSVKLDGAYFLTDFDDLVIHMATLSFQFAPTYQNANVLEARYRSATLDARFSPASWVDLRLSGSSTRAENRSRDGEIVALIDFFGQPREVLFETSRIPYVPRSNGAVSVQLRPPRTGLKIDLAAQFSGEQLIQRFDPLTFNPQTFGDTIEFVPTPDFWVTNARVARAFPAGFEAFVGVDNIGDEVQDDLTDPGTDYTWGPLRGRYVYGGVSYRFDRRP